MGIASKYIVFLSNYVAYWTLEDTKVVTFNPEKNLLSDEGGVIQSKLVAYASQQAHSSAERAALLGGVKVSISPISAIVPWSYTFILGILKTG